MSVYLKGIRLINWRCYQGTHELDLLPTTYAIVAQDAQNPDRSNWLGKSSFGEAIRFALTGQLAKNERAEQWLTEGADEGGVELELSDGTFISRLRTRGSSTQLQVEPPDRHEGVLLKDQAQLELDRITGGSAFYDATAYFGQGLIDRYVQMTPADRTEVVSGWLGLERFGVAEAWLRKNRLAQVEQQLDQCSRLLAQYGQHGTVEQLEQKLKLVEEDLEGATAEQREHRATLDQLKLRQETLRNWQQGQQAKLRVEDLKDQLTDLEREDGKALEKELAANQQVAKTTEAELTEARRKLTLARDVNSGAFDGACPVVEGFSCPARAVINQQALANKPQLDQATREFNRVNTEYQQVSQEVQLCHEAVRAFDRRSGQANVIRGQLREQELLVQQYGDLKEPTDKAVSTEEVTELLVQVTGEVQELQAERQRLQQDLTGWRATVTKMAELNGRVKVLRIGAQLLGRAGIQRVLAEGVLRGIATRTNGAFAEAGVPLGVQVSWAREMDQLDPFCRECGFEYGKTQGRKECPACGARRRPKLDYALQVELSATSGGAGNLSGLMFQLAAGAYLRGRGRGFGALFIDEPFGTVDRANRQAIGARFHSMLERDFGAMQAFVVAHDPDTLDMLPGRIYIISEAGRSRLAVR